MTLSEILTYISNTGLALFLVVWGVWRFDKFLSQMGECMRGISHEMKYISRIIKDMDNCVKKKSEITL